MGKILLKQKTVQIEVTRVWIKVSHLILTELSTDNLMFENCKTKFNDLSSFYIPAIVLRVLGREAKAVRPQP